MIVVDTTVYKHQRRYSDGRTVWLTDAEAEAIADEADRDGIPVDTVIELTAHEDEADAREQERRYRLVRMAVAGEFSAIARQLKIWGIEALR